jgi:hypothetical protein
VDVLPVGAGDAVERVDQRAVPEHYDLVADRMDPRRLGFAGPTLASGASPVDTSSVYAVWGRIERRSAARRRRRKPRSRPKRSRPGRALRCTARPSGIERVQAGRRLRAAGARSPQLIGPTRMRFCNKSASISPAVAGRRDADQRLGAWQP